LSPYSLAYRFDSDDRSIVISNDTTMSDRLIALAKDANVLVHEAMYEPAIESTGRPGAQCVDLAEASRQESYDG
jgi:ribonuclease BN (tRNA processing enzyme)